MNIRSSRLLVLIACCALVTAGLRFQEQVGHDQASPEQVALGLRLFEELNFTNQAADYGASCSGCHTTGSSLKGRTPRAFADYTPRSLTATKATTLRNTPSLVGASKAGAFGWAGEFKELEELVFSKLTGSLLGWAEKDRERALDAIHFTLLNEGSGGGTGASYLGLFKEAYGVDLSTLDPAEAVRRGAKAIGDYVRSLQSTHTSPWDAFADLNRLHTGPNDSEDPKHFAYGVWSRIGNQEGRRLIKRPTGFSADAYMGFRTFFRVDEVDPGAVGNCVTCHVPPDFTDHKFHNMGIAELEYEATHGEGTAASLKAPGEPSPATAKVPSADSPLALDLGRFNVDPSSANLGAFKTPSLRQAFGSDPYMHNGQYKSLTDAVAAHVQAAELARAGKLPWADPELQLIKLTDQDIQQVVAFVEQFQDVPKEDFRSLLIQLADDELTYDW